MSAVPAQTIREALKNRNPVLFRETEAIVGRVTPLLWHSIATFPSGTSHTPEHTATVERVADLLVGFGLRDELNDDELQLLVLACHFHDLGMAGTEAENVDARSRDQARRDHAIRIGDRINAKWQELGFRDQTLASLLSEVCRGHRPQKVEEKASWDDIHEVGIVGPHRKVRLRALAALTYASDELHIGADRAPPRTQEWLEIQDEEARRHWKRHQCINGPVQLGNAVAFEVKVATHVLENDIRSNVLRKAFSAVRDATAQLLIEGFHASLPKMSVQWRREEMFRLLLLEVLADNQPRSGSEIEAAVRHRFDTVRATFHGLSDVCDAESVDGISAEIARVVRDFNSKSYLVSQVESSSDAFTLNLQPRAALEFFRIVGAADKDDVLFSGRYASHHEFDFLRSAFGAAFANQSLVPTVLHGFGVNLATEDGEASTFILACSSPTAARFLTERAPAPSILVKRHLLHLSALAGASLDLVRCPELMLKREFREAFRRVTALVADARQEYPRFIEELAIVGGYNYEQVREATIQSDAAVRELDASTSSGDPNSAAVTAHVHISQKIPPHLPAVAVSFPYLALAAARAEVTVELQNTDEAPFHVSVVSNDDQQLVPGPPTRIAIGRGAPVYPKHVQMRASIGIDSETGALEFQVRELGEDHSRELPVILGVPLFALTKSGAAQTQLAFYTPAVTVEHIRVFEDALARSRDGNVEITIIRAKDGKQWARLHIPLPKMERLIPRFFDSEILAFIRSVLPNAPLPFGVLPAELQCLRDPNCVERTQLIERYSARPSTEKDHVTSITLRCANSDGRDYSEEYLDLFPQVTFGAPKIVESPELSQAELNRRWINPSQEMTMSASFPADFHQIAQDIRQWANDPAAAFPFNVASGPPTSPIFKSVIEIVICPYVDRVWFVERPVLIRVRPIRKMEQWEVEAAYWESINDNDRSGILRDRIQDMAKLKGVASP